MFSSAGDYRMTYTNFRFNLAMAGVRGADIGRRKLMNMFINYKADRCNRIYCGFQRPSSK